uniref:Uncharacterized protein n=1 Tax=Aegilops tauschii subsp. strangulata TaxID=200361 RepID=A0A453AXG6_AEGTS
MFWVMGFYWVAEECRRRKSAAAAFNRKGWRQVMEGGQLPASSSEKREVSCGEHREEGESSRERRTGRSVSVGSATSNCSSERPESVVNVGRVEGTVSYSPLPHEFSRSASLHFPASVIARVSDDFWMVSVLSSHTKFM